MSTLRDKILAASKTAPREVVAVAEWDVEVEIRGLTVRSRARLFGGAEAGKVDMEKVYPDLLIACCHDPETGEALFTEADRPALLEAPVGPIDVLAQAALRVSGLAAEEEGKDPVNDAAKNSEASLSVVTSID